MAITSAPVERSVERYVAATPKSRAFHERAAAALTGGTTRTSTYFDPYPPAVTHGEGCFVWDLDGNRRADFLNNYTSLILGHAHPDVVAATQAAIARGSAFAAPTENEVVLAEMIKARVSSVERVRLTNSGTEATMFAMRCARALTGRPMIAKFEGSYHGTHDFAVAPTGIGIPEELKALVIELPYNDAEGTEQRLEPFKDRVAAVIIEPVIGAGGVIPADKAFLSRLRELTSAWGMFLIFDEIISLRVAPGGAQALHGVLPDLTTMGKIIGGGFPAAAVGGREDIMAAMDQRRGSGFISHGGTFNGNPVGTAAGIATLEHLTPDVYQRLNALGERARMGLGDLFERRALPMTVTGIGSLFNIHATRELVRDSHAIRRSNQMLLKAIVLGLMSEGYWLAPRGMGCISTPMTEAEIDGLVDATERVVDDIGL